MKNENSKGKTAAKKLKTLPKRVKSGTGSSSKVFFISKFFLQFPVKFPKIFIKFLPEISVEGT